MGDAQRRRICVPRFLGQKRIQFSKSVAPVPGPGQLLIQVKGNAVCASDLGLFAHGASHTPGHETAGIVAGVGLDAQVAVGTPGVIYLMDFCGECRSCRLGYTNQCLAKRADYGFSHDGGYGPYMVVNENVFFAIGPDINLRDATLLLDVMGTGGHAISRAQRAREDIESVLITGAGPIGLGVAAMTRLILGRDLPVLITDLVPYRLELARKLGCAPIDVREQPVSDALRAHGLDRVDVAIDTSGKALARRQALDVVGKRGALVCVGHGEGLDLSVSGDLIAPERSVLGSEYFRFDELAPNLARLRAHRDYLAQIITHRFPVSELQVAFETFIAGNTGKVVVEQ